MREYMVCRLGRPEDTTKPRLQQEGLNLEDMEQEVPRAAPQARRNERVPRPILDDFVANRNHPRNGHGYYVKPADREDKSGQIVHTNEESAVAYAKELAAKNPKVLYGVFTCVRVFETTEPNVIEKSFNDSGELIIDKEKEENV